MENQSEIFITGGGGMLATAFREFLPDAVYADSSQFDISNQQHRLGLLESKPRVVINLAAYTKVDAAEADPEAAERVNGAGVGALARTCKRIGATLVHFSTDYVFDGSIHRPLRPDDPVGPKSAYGRSKLIGEQLIQLDPPPRWLIIRTAWLYGPGGPNFPATMLDLARADKPIKVIDDQIGSPTYTMDLVIATIDLLNSSARGIYHVSNAGQANWYDFAERIFKYAKVRADLSRTNSAQWRADRPNSAPRPSYSVLDGSSFEVATGKGLRSWKKALRDYIERYQQPVG